MERCTLTLTNVVEEIQRQLCKEYGVEEFILDSEKGWVVTPIDEDEFLHAVLLAELALDFFHDVGQGQRASFHRGVSFS